MVGQSGELSLSTDEEKWSIACGEIGLRGSQSLLNSKGMGIHERGKQKGVGPKRNPRSGCSSWLISANGAGLGTGREWGRDRERGGNGAGSGTGRDRGGAGRGGKVEAAALRGLGREPRASHRSRGFL